MAAALVLMKNIQLLYHSKAHTLPLFPVVFEIIVKSFQSLGIHFHQGSPKRYRNVCKCQNLVSGILSCTNSYNFYS